MVDENRTATTFILKHAVLTQLCKLMDPCLIRSLRRWSEYCPTKQVTIALVHELEILP